MLSTIYRLPRIALAGLVRAYQLTVSPHLNTGCRYTPTCSWYAIEALDQYGAIKGVILAVWRILRCHPWGRRGYDPPRWFGEERTSELPLDILERERAQARP